MFSVNINNFIMTCVLIEDFGCFFILQKLISSLDTCFTIHSIINIADDVVNVVEQQLLHFTLIMFYQKPIHLWYLILKKIHIN